MEQDGNTSLEPDANHSGPPRCDQCSLFEDGPCVSHSRLTIADRALPPKAIATLPEQLELRDVGQESVDDYEHGKGVFAKTSIPGETIFGPLVGTLIQAKATSTRAFNFGLVVEGGIVDGNRIVGSTVMHYRLTSDAHCNWMMYVRLSDDPSKVNLMAYQHGAHVYFTALKTLVEGDELIVGYSLQYAKAIGMVSPDTHVGTMLPNNRQTIIPIVNITQIPLEKDIDVDMESLASADTFTPTAHHELEEGSFSPTYETDKSTEGKIIPTQRSEPPRKRGRPRRNLTSTVSIQPNPDQTSSDEKEIAEAVAQLAQLQQFNHSLPEQISSIRHIQTGNEPGYSIEHDLGNMEEKPFEALQLAITQTIDREMNLPVVRITEANTSADEFQMSDFLSTDEPQPVMPRRTRERRILSRPHLRRLEARPSKAKDLTLPPAAVVEAGEETPTKDRKKRASVKVHKVDLFGALVEIPVGTPRGGGSKQPIMEKQHLLESAEKLPTASKLLASNMRYRYKCPEQDCSAHFRIPGLLSIHETKHGNEVPEEFRGDGPKSCPGCESELPDWDALVEHVKSHERQHNRKDRKGRTGGVKCETCGKEFAGEKYLVTHVQRLHSGEAEKTVKCNQCDKTFFTTAAMRSHENFQHGMRKGFECPVCLESFKGGLNLNIHGETHRVDSNFPCRLCPKVFSSWLILIRHMKQQHKTTKVVCDVCQKPFKNNGALDRHQKVHYDAFDYACEICGRRFKQKPLFEAHQKRLHNPDRQYRFKERSEKVAKSYADAVVCGICHRQYNSQERLEEHQRVKHGKVTPESEEESE
ncbi:hypothetical protein RvY_16109 [Ramazzottius varieornatus]|uniref:SET domain-containing protein n=1 Tax=Ramazzottius varieornatus TaxID=947166 RepID=A0A1D1W099_RAMVA|nr:hypothetical protein RvY_16109 [Ramazzottius varieornatus]